MEKKSLFKRVTALLCCIVMLVTTVPVYAADPNQEATMTVKNSSGAEVKFYADSGCTQEIESDSGKNVGDTVLCKNAGGNLVFWSTSDNLAGRAVIFYAAVPDGYTFEVTSGVDTDAEAVSAGTKSLRILDRRVKCTIYKIEAYFWEDSLGDEFNYNFSAKVVAPQVTVNFTSSDSSSRIQVQEGDKWKTVIGSYSVEKGTPLTFKITNAKGSTDPSKDYIVLVDDEPLEPDTGSNATYTITSVQGNTNVLVFSTTKVLEVTLPNVTSTDPYEVDGGATVDYGTPYTFYVKPKDGYDAPAVSYKVGEGESTPITPSSGNTYVISASNVTGNITITVGEASRNKFNVTAPANNYNGFTYTGNETVDKGKDFIFTVAPNDGYGTPTVKYTVGDSGEEKNPQYLGNNQYLIKNENVTDNITIIVTAGNAKTYNVSFTGNNFTAKFVEVTETEDEDGNKTVKVEEIEGNQTFRYNADAKFKVTAADGYEIASVVARETTLACDSNGVYTVDNVTGNVIVTVTTREKNYTVTYAPADKDNTAFTVAYTTTTAKYGTDYSFTVTPKPGYAAPTVAIKVGDNSVEYTESNGQYTFRVTGDTTVTVTAGGVSVYTVKGATTNGVTWDDGSVTVAHGGSASLSFTVDPKYNTANMIVTVNGEDIATPTPVGGRYTVTVESVTADTTVKVTGLKLNTYEVTFENGDGYTFSKTSTTVEAGESLTFSLNLSQGYEKSDKFAVTANGKTCDPDDDGFYNVTINANTRIAVAAGGVVLKTFEPKITAPNATVEPVGSAKISYNGAYSFRVKADDYYKVSTVLVNSAPVTADNGVYTISNVTSAPEIYVEADKNVLTVSYVSTEKNHECSETHEFTVDDISGALDYVALHKCQVHNFLGWYVNDVQAYDQYLMNLIKDKDAMITLTAKFEVAPSALQMLFSLDPTTGTVTAANPSATTKKYKVTYNTTANVTNDGKADACFEELARVVAAGTLLANDESVLGDKNEALINQLHLGNYSEKGKVTAENILGDKSVYNYSNGYGSDGLTMDVIDGRYTWLSINTNTPENLYASGWMELTVGGKHFVFIAEQCNVKVDNEDTAE